jgi:hypothetical protein
MAKTAEAHALRSEFRAKLLDYSAAGLEQFGDRLGAEAKRRDADLFRIDADLTRRYDAACRAVVEHPSHREWLLLGAALSVQHKLGETNPKDAARYAELDSALRPLVRARQDEALALRLARSGWRQIGEDLGLRGQTAIINDFAEPSDDELLAGVS